MMDSGQKISISPEELAQGLFLRVLEDTHTVLATHNERFKKYPSFQPSIVSGKSGEGRIAATSQ
jgi:hypothetical protein